MASSALSRFRVCAIASLLLVPAAVNVRAAGTIEYSHGDPSDEDQQFLELMNRARMDPSAEADRIFDDYGSERVRSAVNFFLAQRPAVEFSRAENRDAFRSYPARPPFAFNAKLLTAATLHTAEMKSADEQSHQLPGEAALGARISAQGYSFSNVGESVFAFADNPLHAHAAFAIDYGQGVAMGNTRPTVGHRDSLMNFSGARLFVEAGVAILNDTSAATDVGPKLITIDFGQPSDGSRFVTGVCWQDQNGNAFYDPGEGIPGVRIESPATTFFTISSSSGGYALPVPANAGAIEVTAIGTPATPSEIVGTQIVPVVMGPENVKLDFAPPADPPPPPFRAFTASSASGSAPSGGFFETTFSVSQSDPADELTVGDLLVPIEIRHADLSLVTVTLRSPAGTTVALFSGKAMLTKELAGTFGSSLDTSESLSAFVGQAYTGTWTLRVTNGNSSGAAAVDVAPLQVRPSWVRPVFAPPGELSVTKFSVIDGVDPNTDTVTVQATFDAIDFDAGDEAADPKPVLLRVATNDASRTTLFTIDLTAQLAAGRATLKHVRPRAGGTSKASIKAKATAQEIAGLGTLPAEVYVEITADRAIAGQSIPLVGGAYRSSKQRPVGGGLIVDSISTKVSGAVTFTTVKGRWFGGTDTTGVVEVIAGGNVAKVAGSVVTTSGTKRTVKSSGALRKLVLDTSTGVFTAKIAGASSLFESPNRVRFAMRWSGEHADDLVGTSGTGPGLLY